MNNNCPKISIVTPVYNQVGLIESTITSVLSQNYPNLEYIIIDGGSTDGTVDIIKKYENQLAYWCSEPDKGMYDAIRKGFEKSTGDIMAWINSDDMYHHNALDVVSEVFSSFEQVEWIQGIQSIMDKKGRTYSVNVCAGPTTKYDFYLRKKGWLQQESIFWRRTLYDKVGGINTELKYAGDFDLWRRFFQVADLYNVVALIGGFRLWSPTQLSTQGMTQYEEEVNTVLSKMFFTDDERFLLKKYKILMKIEELFFKLLRGFKWERLFNKSKCLSLNYHTKIVFDNETRHFVVTDL